MNYHLHNNRKLDGEMLGKESGQNDYEIKVAKAVSELVCESLNINWNDRRIVRELIYTSIVDHFISRNKLLSQYLHTQLDILADTIRHEFNIPKDIAVNYDHAIHAKFNDLLKYIKS